MQRERRKQRILEVASLHAAPSKKSGRITSFSAPRHPPKKPLLPLLPLHFKVLVFKVLFFIRVHSRLRPSPDCSRSGGRVGYPGLPGETMMADRVGRFFYLAALTSVLMVAVAAGALGSGSLERACSAFWLGK